MDIDHSAALTHGLVDVCLGNGDLLLVLLLVLAKLGAPWDLDIRSELNLNLNLYLRLGLISIQIWSHFQVFASR